MMLMRRGLTQNSLVQTTVGVFPTPFPKRRVTIGNMQHPDGVLFEGEPSIGFNATQLWLGHDDTPNHRVYTDDTTAVSGNCSGLHASMRGAATQSDRECDACEGHNLHAPVSGYGLRRPNSYQDRNRQLLEGADLRPRSASTTPSSCPAPKISDQQLRAVGVKHGGQHGEATGVTRDRNQSYGPWSCSWIGCASSSLYLHIIWNGKKGK
jgi:hypothetical protein